MGERRLVIAGTGSGSGKTTVAVGLMKAFKQQGYEVQGFKCGPDYIDPTYHTAVTKRRSRNLDSWMMTPEVMQEVLRRGSKEVDISIVEGVMGFYDGKDPTSNKGSTAEISVLTKSPVILVVDCGGVARSAAAIVKGFQSLSADVNIQGVIANQVGSKRHFELIQEAVELECEIPVVGYLQKDGALTMPERHLGLVPSIERGNLDDFFEDLGEKVTASVDLKKLYDLAETKALAAAKPSVFKAKPHRDVQIAVARDAAFTFYYEENLELLEAYGANIVYFSPLQDEPVPEGTDGLYFGGGFPEVFADQLASNTTALQSVRSAIEKGMPTVAECGGFMYLCEQLATVDNEVYQMVGLIPGSVQMHERLQAIGYREVQGENFLLAEGLEAKGHEFHYSSFQANESFSPAFKTKGMRGEQQEGYVHANLVAGYTHLHFASCPELVENWITCCKEEKMDG
ncbi:cobyrinate a,c-diamide synthase [Salsuginibacillus kocurii]|uniref:cobyrinate a,c-diamide synthase n=1 Tax=Salsuginibacillus kocurii TaxID=427078 RepID=UPI000366EF8F|nr:cobyrinate a,c-diamide synthase [Salsuginibacillus kocurii]